MVPNPYQHSEVSTPYRCFNCARVSVTRTQHLLRVQNKKVHTASASYPGAAIHLHGALQRAPVQAMKGSCMGLFPEPLGFNIVGPSFYGHKKAPLVYRNSHLCEAGFWLQSSSLMCSSIGVHFCAWFCTWGS